jgi:hypothetical protein
VKLEGDNAFIAFLIVVFTVIFYLLLLVGMIYVVAILIDIADHLRKIWF